MVNSKKAQIWISGVLYLLVATMVVTLVLSAGIPLINKMRDQSKFNNVVTNMRTLDSEIEKVLSGGEGSQNIVPLMINDGELKIQNNQIIWSMESKSDLMELNSQSDLGDLTISSDIDVTAKDNGTHFNVENSRISFSVLKVGSPQNYSSINTSEIIQNVKLKENNATLDGSFSMMLLNDPNTAIGTGYTHLINSGENIPSTSIRVYVNSSNYEYSLMITLLSKSDFWKVSLGEVIVK